MTNGGAQVRYAHVRYPWRAAVDVRAPGPARFYASLIRQAMRYGLPARRRFAPLWTFAGRHQVPEAPLAGLARVSSKRARPDLDELLAALPDEWARLAAGARALPAEPPALTALALERSAARTVFVFGGDDAHPLLVMKVPVGRAELVELEAAALEEARPADVAPRDLGWVAGARVQEALRGRPLWTDPITPESARTLPWGPAQESLTAGFARLAETTAKPLFADELRKPMALVLDSGRLSSRAQSALAAAWSDWSKVDLSVLRHHDTSPQNTLFDGDRLSGLVDWEMAVTRGVPAFDTYNAALSYTEGGVGLVRWSHDLVVETFRNAWLDSPYWHGMRRAARESAAAAGVPDSALDSLELVFFGSRVGDRLARPGHLPTDDAMSAALLEIVVAG